ncbi:unnamed protein product [Phytomonas sp. EM1]|nr:unnamed protein product [Phytomonas sp. EM1]|eukprot:CCW60974.1 unnamed protein product [Phytomonas sp. isolate EM1]
MPGGFEVVIPIRAPDARAREKIILALTRPLRDAGVLPPGVSFRDFARRAVGFSGSDLANLVGVAVSHALLRQQPTPTAASPELVEVKPGEASFRLRGEDFDRALREVRRHKDATGFVSGERMDELEGAEARGEVVDYDGTFERNWNRVRELIAQVHRSRHVCSGVVALTGGVGSGKTTLARQLAARAHEHFSFSASFPIHLISCRRLCHTHDPAGRVRRVREAICAASRSERGLVVLEDYDALLDSLANLPDQLNALKAILDTFARGGGDVDCDLTAADSLDGLPPTSPSRPVMVVSVTRESALQSIPYDLHLHRFPLSFSDLQRLLRHYRIANQTSLLRAVAQAYPPSISYRQFLRLTDMALWKLGESLKVVENTTSGSEASDVRLKVEREGAPDGEGNATSRTKHAYESPWFFASVADDERDGGSARFLSPSLADLRARQERENVFALPTSDLARRFVFIVQEVVGLTRLMDPFARWYQPSPAVNGYEGDEATDGVDIDAEGGGLEALW